jgi:ribosomal 30S subunit maturation factor RimM
VRHELVEKKGTNVPRTVSRLHVNIDLIDDSEHGAPIVTPRSLLTIRGTIDDFSFSHPLSTGSVLIINGLPLGTVENVTEERDGECLNIFAEASGSVFIPNAKQNLADITARYRALKLEVKPDVTLEDKLGRALHRIEKRVRGK